MKYENLYNNLEDELQKKETLAKLIDIYSKRDKFYDFYVGLIKTATKEYPSQYNKDEKNQFYVSVFNRWKNGYLKYLNSNYDMLIIDKEKNKVLIRLKEYLESLPEVTTSEEIHQLLCSEKVDKEIRHYLNNSLWENSNEVSGWVHVKSSYVNFRKEKEFKIENRLCINTEGIDTHKMAKLFLEKCEENNLEYYFKFSSEANRDDTIVIYSDTKKLPEYIKILKQIAVENEDMIKRCKQPPLLTSKIDNWIGYGAEPQQDKDGKSQSFNSIRAREIESAIEKETKEWLKKYKGIKLNYKKRKIPLEKYLTETTIDNILESKQKLYNYYKENNGNKETEQMLEYTLKDLKDRKLRRKIKKELHPKIVKFLSKYIEGDTKDFLISTISLNHGQKLNIYGQDIVKSIDKLAPIIFQADQLFAENVKKSIYKKLSAVGISDEKSSCNKDTKDKFIKQDEKLLKSTYEDLVKLATAKKKEKPKEKLANMSLNEYYKYLKQYFYDNLCNNKKDSNDNAKSKDNKNMTRFRNGDLYNLKKEEILQDLPLNSNISQHFVTPGMTEKEIKLSQQKIKVFTKK